MERGRVGDSGHREPKGVKVPVTVEHISHDRLTPNPWNPNRMDEAMFAKERASIRSFGFVDPLTVRDIRDGDMFEIIDGEHRWKAGYAEGIDIFPCVVLDVDDDEARELTIILNDTRGTMQDDRLALLVQELNKRREASRLAMILPYDKARMEQLLERREIDWSELEKRRDQMQRQAQQSQEDEGDRWVERVYRMPESAASVVDEAVATVRQQDDIGQDWRALEMIAADFLGK